MISLHYKFTSYADLVQQLAARLGAPVNDNVLTVPPGMGTGFFKIIRPSNDLEALVYNFRLNEDILVKRQKDAAEFYVLIFDEVNDTAGYSISIGSEKLSEAGGRSAAIFLNSFLYDAAFFLHKNVEIRGLRVLLSVPWMQQYLQLKERESVLEKYIALKTSGILYKPVDAELRGLLHDLLANENAPLLFSQNRILRIVENFFAWLYDEMKIIADQGGITRSDIEKAQKVEGILTNDVTVVPSTLKELAKEVAVSESKLKKIFKAVYGLPPYEYYQKKRMQQARLMLLSGDYSVKDVGYTLGYANLSNFTLAFKKEFGKLPSEVAKEKVSG